MVTDPVLSRKVLCDHTHFSLLGEGGVGHLWEQILGDYVPQLFDGPGHADLRHRARDLFTEANSTALVQRVAGPVYEGVTSALTEGREVDIAYAARQIVGRMMADLLGLHLGGTAGADSSAVGGGSIAAEAAGTVGATRAATSVATAPDSASAPADAEFVHLFESGERLAALALGSAASTVLPAERIQAARAIIGELTRDVPDSYAHAPTNTLLGRCREAGLTLEETTGLACLLLVAGTETAASAMTRTVALLHDTGQFGALLADPARLPDAVREGLRVSTPAPVIGRHVVSDVELGGRRMRAEDRVLLSTYTADNRIGGFDITRPYVAEARQLWFGAGRHLCLGAPVARAEIGQLLQSLTDAGRPYRIVSRRYARGVMIPTYASLIIAADG
ncbi:MAG TPA: cytochrome P450 [Actinocrinis sp.]|nr:cytochrome P450 [Actinocrinis sp.]